MTHHDWDDEDHLDEEWSDEDDDLDEALDDAEAARCPECGAWMYDVTGRCPKCGYWLSSVDRLTMWRSQPKWVRVTALVVLAAFLVWLFGGVLRLVG